MKKNIQPEMVCMVFGHPNPELNGKQVVTKQLMVFGQEFTYKSKRYVWQEAIPAWRCACPSERAFVFCWEKHLFPIEDGEFREIEQQQEVSV